jgi:DNA-binding transcriptional MerR regulator
MNISQLAQRTHIKAHTIRFYEKEGLVPQRCVRRRRNNYRDYGEEAVEGNGFDRASSTKTLLSPSGGSVVLLLPLR